MVLLDKGLPPNPGGSTGHASNFIFLVDHSKEMTKFTLDGVAQYKSTRLRCGERLKATLGVKALQISPEGKPK